jgi:hypothetical protein
MIRIFNNKLSKVILIDDKNEFVAFVPKQYEEGNPHVLIELEGIDFFRHSKKCEDCKAFVHALGTYSHDWYIDMNGKVERLNLYGLGKKYTDNKATLINSYFFYGTKLKLNIDNDTVEDLKVELKKLEQSEQYEECCFLRDKIKAISNEDKTGKV